MVQFEISQFILVIVTSAVLCERFICNHFHFSLHHFVFFCSKRGALLSILFNATLLIFIYSFIFKNRWMGFPFSFPYASCTGFCVAQWPVRWGNMKMNKHSWSKNQQGRSVLTEAASYGDISQISGRATLIYYYAQQSNIIATHVLKWSLLVIKRVTNRPLELFFCKHAEEFHRKHLRGCLVSLLVGDVSCSSYFGSKA